MIFRPGISTRKRGWGLGLTLAKRIVELNHRGRIKVLHSELGKGTTFRIQLPIRQNLVRSGWQRFRNLLRWTYGGVLPFLVHALFLASFMATPTKALAHDQLRRLRAMAQVLGVEGVFPYDGDTPSATRRQARERGLVLLSNPDMLHYGLLPRHPDWAPFLARLRYVVLDELHAYRGVFGTHVALILRRLLRLARHYGASPQVLAASATIANAREHAEALTGLPFEELKAQVARTERELLVLLPKPLDRRGERRRSPLLEAAYLARRLAEAGLKGLVFAGARKSAELIARYAAHPLVRPYRAGYTARERRRLEADLKEGRVRVLVSTSALELGVDIGELDAVVLVGYPGSTAAFWQRAGRAGRGAAAAAAAAAAAR